MAFHGVGVPEGIRSAARNGTWNQSLSYWSTAASKRRVKKRWGGGHPFAETTALFPW